MMRTSVILAALTVLLTTGACGATSSQPGSSSEDPADTTDGAEATTGEVEPTTADDAPVTLDPGEDADGGDDELLVGVRGDSPFHLDGAEVRVAESEPVQLFLDVEGNAPTPCHTVAYEVQEDDGGYAVHVTTVAGPGMCAQVLQPHSFSIPLGEAPELPVTVDVNDGAVSLTVEG